MDKGLLLQYLIIGLAVLVSAWGVLKKQFPGVVRKLRGGGGWRRLPPAMRVLAAAATAAGPANPSNIECSAAPGKPGVAAFRRLCVGLRKR